MTHAAPPYPDADQTTEEEQKKGSSMPVDPAVGAAVGGVLGIALLTWVLSRLRLRRRRPQTPSEKLVQAGRDASTVVGHHAGRLASEAGEAAHRAAMVATPVAVAGAGVIAEQSRRAASRLHEAGSHAAESGAHAREEIVESLEHAQRKVSRFFLKLLAALSFGGGYVLGAQAGRERYDQIVRAAGQVRTRVTGV